VNELPGVMQAATEVETFCRQRAWAFCFIGGIAVQRWGTPRFTQDVDLTLLTGFGSEAQFVDEVLRHFAGRVKDTRRFALEHRVLLVQTPAGVHVDVALGAFPFEAESIQRATAWKVSEQAAVTTCSAEDLIIHKVFASRDRDWSDVESVLVRQHGRLDLERVQRELPPLLELKDDMESFSKLQRMIADVDRRRKP
jgi:hypothetical protein